MSETVFLRKVVMGGMPRSGSSLLRNLLNGHPRIAAPPETAIFTRNWPETQRKGSKVGERLKARLGIPEATVTDCLQTAGNEVEFFDLVIGKWLAQTERQGVDTWVEKTPRNCLRYHELAEEFPDLLFRFDDPGWARCRHLLLPRP